MNRRTAVYTLMTVALAASVAVSLIASPALARKRHHRSDDYYSQQNGQQSEQYQPRRSGERNVAGEFDYYALVLSWSPSFCADGRHDNSPQCSTASARPYSFVLHGLWPQYQKGWPQNCRTERSPYVPEPLIGKMLDIMPAKKLIIHEYKKHGTCSGLDPEGYFALSRKLFTAIKLPENYQSPTEPQFISPQDLMNDFMASNPAIKPEMIAVGCGGPGNRLKDVHICVSRDGQPTACGRNEAQRKMCSADKMAVLPVRASSRSDSQPRWTSAPVAAPKRTLSGAILHYFGRN